MDSHHQVSAINPRGGLGMGWRGEIGRYVLLITLSFGVYSNSLYGEWVFDDVVAILRNKDVLPSTPWEDLWHHDFWGNNIDDWQSHKSFRPVTIASFRLNYIMAGERFDEFSFHIVNVALHALAAALSLPLFRSLLAYPGCPEGTALAASALFATHPIHTDAVSSIVSRGEPLSAVMFILSLRSYIALSSPPSTPRGWAHDAVCHMLLLPVSAALAFIGLLCKEPAITVVGAQIAYDLTLGAGVIPGAYQALNRAGSCEGKKSNIYSTASQLVNENEACCAGAGNVGGHDTKDECGCRGDVRAGAGRRRWVFFAIRMVFLVSTYAAMYVWRISKNGECITVYKVLGDPNTSAWDVAGTVAPGIYSRASCKPNFLKLENPARWAKGPGADMTRLMTWSHLVPMNACLLALPVTLMADYSDNTVPLITEVADTRNAFTVAFFAALVLVILFSLRQSFRSAPGLLLALSLLIGPFIPSSNLFFPVGFVIAERTLYLPSMGFCLLLSLTLYSCMPPSAAQQATVVIVAGYSARTLLRNRDWSTREVFFAAMVRDNPRGPKGHYGLGVTIVHNKDKEERGVWHLEEATRLQPLYFDAFNDLGAHFNTKGDYVRAAKSFEEAIRIKPEHIDGISNLGLNYLFGKEYEKAFDAFDSATQLFPDVASFYNNLGQALLGLEMGEDALDALASAITLSPVDFNSYKQYGIAAGQLGKQDVAEMYLRNALRINPRDAESLHNLGVSLMKQERSGEAYAYFLRAVRLNPTDEKKQNGLIKLRESLGLG